MLLKISSKISGHACDYLCISLLLKLEINISNLNVNFSGTKSTPVIKFSNSQRRGGSRDLQLATNFTRSLEEGYSLHDKSTESLKM